MASNRLANETSPYLLQHAHNPVDWYPWGPEALERARREDRPLFVSIGYSACHWCHVMERESFENDETAALMNEYFVNVKIDREERPDLDDVYMAAVQAMTGSGGWPMSVFLTPELQPFFGGTYFPPEDRHGLPAFRRVLEAVADAYRTRRTEIDAQARQLADHVRSQVALPAGSIDPERRQLELAAQRLLASFDPVHGGFGGAPKFPASMSLEFLMRSWHRSGDDAVRRAVTITLDRMADGGIHDQLGGGFARYSTDAAWLVPHFEKMLYDNALLALCYLDAFRAFGVQRYAEVAGDTLDFMLAELRTGDGGLAAALDADSEGDEGRYYVWSADEVRSVLAAAGLADDEVGAVCAHWDVTDGGNWEGRNILHVRGPAPPAPLIERARSALMASRSSRVRPARDEKQLAAWNGLALRALAGGVLVLGDDRYLAAVDGLVAFVRSQLLRDGDRLWRTARGGVAHTPAFAEDYADLADGLLAAHAATGEAAHLVLARALIDRLVVDFWDDESGTLYDTSAEHETTVVRPRSLVDSATPSANSVAADVLLRLALLTGEPDYDRRARSILRTVGPALERQPSVFGRMLSAVDRSLVPASDAVVAAADPRTQTAMALRRAVSRPFAPDLVVAGVTSGAATQAWPVFLDKVPVDGHATAYVCRGYACEEPTGDPANAARQVERAVRG